jgi:hypothetical protein
MTRFDPDKNRKTAEEWSILALRATRENNLQWQLIGGIVGGAIAASAAGPVTGILVALYFIWEAWNRVGGIQRNQTAIVQFGCIAQTLDGEDFEDYVRHVGRASVLEELDFATRRGLSLSQSASDFYVSGEQKDTHTVVQEQETELADFAHETPDVMDLPKLLAKTLKVSLIVGVPAVGKGIFVSNALEALKASRKKVTIFYIDPKYDPKETLYFSGRVDKLFRKNFFKAEPSEAYKWVKDCLEIFDNFDCGTDQKLLVWDELSLTMTTLKLVEGASNWLKSKLSVYSSSGSSRGIVIWGISQNAHVSGLGLDGGDRSIFCPVFLIDGKNISASEGILRAKMIPSDKKLSSSEIQAICAKSPINRAIYFGETNKWYPLPKMKNFSGYDRDNRSFLPGYTLPETNPMDKQQIDDVIESLDKIYYKDVSFDINTKRILYWLENNKKGEWIKFKGKEDRDINFIKFLSLEKIDCTSRDIAIKILIEKDLVEISDDKNQIKLRKV